MDKKDYLKDVMEKLKRDMLKLNEGLTWVGYDYAKPERGQVTSIEGNVIHVDFRSRENG
jgi:hypothetical protein